MIVHVVAIAAGAGAWLRWSVGVAGVAMAAAAAARWRRPVLVVVLAFVAAGWWSARAVDAFEPPAARSVEEEWITLTSDPRASGPVGVRASAVWGGHRVSLSAHGPVGGRLDDHLAGEQVQISGSFRPLRSNDSFARWRHEVGTIVVVAVEGEAAASPLGRLANGIRRTLLRGAGSLGRDDRAIFAGMVLGDDREQSAVVADDFRAAGLGHLLVVSGQNVAFVVALLGPLTRRVRPAGRLGLVAMVLLLFVTITRFEASVLRATVMAGVGVGAAVLGGPVDGRRALSISLAVLVALDPFLVRVLAFQLSVAATAGIVWLGLPLAERLPGPAIVRVAAATTTSAQLAVAPLLVATFGPVPLLALPANLLAGPASGPIMMWGCTAGLVAGVAGGGVAAVIHVPTGLLVGWVRGVAALTASLPFVGIGAGGVVMLVLAVGLGLRRSRFAVGIASMLAVVALVASVGARPQVGPGPAAVGAGVTVWGGDVVLVALDDPGRPRDVLEHLRLAGVTEVDMVVAADGDRADADAVVALRARFGDVRVVAPPMHRVPTASSVHPGDTIVFPGGRVVLGAEGDTARLRIDRCAMPPCQDVVGEES